ncbi:MAG: GNAT family N-acetyltransferase [Candidatus Hodarchaeota archaeon]
MDFTIRPLKNNEYKSIEELYEQKVGKFTNNMDKENFRRYLNLNIDLIKVAILQTEILGYIIGYQSNVRKSRIYSIYIRPEYRKKHIGSNLIQSLEKTILKQSDIEYLSVRIPEAFFNSIDFFRKNKFEIVTLINNYRKDDLNFPFKTNPKTFIRPANIHDTQELLEIEKNSFSPYWRMSYEDFTNRILLERNSFFVATIENKIIGYNYNTLSSNGTDGYYVRIAIHPKYRQKKVSTTLTSNAFNWFKKKRVKRIFLSTYADSEAHNQMYKSWGFKYIDQEIILTKMYI